jgi:hypothetical protein
MARRGKTFDPENYFDPEPKEGFHLTGFQKQAIFFLIFLSS